MAKSALITGITGQDGSYLAELLLSKGYEVHGLTRRASTFNRGRIDHITDAKSCAAGVPWGNIVLHYGDLCDGSSVNRLLRSVRPDEIYNLAAQSHVKISFEIPEYTGDVAGLGTLRILEGIRESGLEPKSIRPAPRRCSAKCRKFRKRRRPPSIRGLLTGQPKFMPIGLR